MDWQKNPESIKIERVQYWRRGIMLTAQMTKEAAQELVENGEAFVITGQAIGAVINGKKAS